MRKKGRERKKGKGRMANSNKHITIYKSLYSKLNNDHAFERIN